LARFLPVLGEHGSSWDDTSLSGNRRHGRVVIVRGVQGEAFHGGRKRRGTRRSSGPLAGVCLWLLDQRQIKHFALLYFFLLFLLVAVNLCCFCGCCNITVCSERRILHHFVIFLSLLFGDVRTNQSYKTKAKRSTRPE